jgi:hypothetical protein
LQRGYLFNRFNKEKITQDGDVIIIKTISFHCETCNVFIDSKDDIVEGVRRAKADRRKKPASDGENSNYKGPERRSGTERRIWVDRIAGIRSKM